MPKKKLDALHDALTRQIDAFHARSDTHAGHAANFGRDVRLALFGEFIDLQCTSTVSGETLTVEAKSKGCKNFKTSFDWTQPPAVSDGDNEEDHSSDT